MTDNSIPYALVAEDDVIIRMDAIDILETAGFRIIEASNVEEALKLLNDDAEKFDLLFTDVQMPPSEQTGFDLARHCSKHWPHIRILIASGMMVSEDNDVPDGAIFVRKPFCAHVIYNHLQVILPDSKRPELLKKMVI
ncbi:response regulator [Pseudochrobactrum kiredjianiae]|uniref:Polar-differentiation response regulator DivK n=1 Tax=Pseudochrobactrum kiredjianiae TaxID=386305 RepID=A0ABW3UY98_9HYPH|nr:response regulator [Pseudochrobactrum kiredjianiae]MDM7852483.1 response regulator [Pseudochrobactrum kiredjianiae]